MRRPRYPCLLYNSCYINTLDAGIPRVALQVRWTPELGRTHCGVPTTAPWLLIPAARAVVHRAAMCCIARILPAKRPLSRCIAETASSALLPPPMAPGFGDMYGSSCLAARVSVRTQAEQEISVASPHTLLPFQGKSTSKLECLGSLRIFNCRLSPEEPTLVRRRQHLRSNHASRIHHIRKHY